LFPRKATSPQDLPFRNRIDLGQSQAISWDMTLFVEKKKVRFPIRNRTKLQLVDSNRHLNSASSSKPTQRIDLPLIYEVLYRYRP
jgi:hypothetical protein